MDLTPEEKAKLRVDNTDSYRANALPSLYKPAVPPSGVQMVPTRTVRVRETGAVITVNAADADDPRFEPVEAQAVATGQGAAIQGSEAGGQDAARALEALTVAQLTALASERKVDLGEATRKADIIAALVAAGAAAP